MPMITRTVDEADKTPASVIHTQKYFLKERRKKLGKIILANMLIVSNENIGSILIDLREILDKFNLRVKKVED